MRWALIGLALVAGCTGAGSTATTLNLAPICRQLTTEIVDRAQEFVDRFADSTLADFPEGELPGLEELRAEIDVARADALGRGCGDFGFEEMLAAEARSISGQGPIGRPLAASLRGEDPAAGPPETVELGPDDDLAGTLYRLGGGSVVNLAAGTYDLEEALLVDRELTINGAGVGRTTIQSTAREGAILVVQPGALSLSDVAVEHSGEAPANVVVAAGSGLLLESVHLSGAVADPEGEEGGHGLLLLGPEGSARSVVSDSQFVGNERIGLAMFGTASAHIGGVVASGNGVCGICLFDDATADLESSSLVGNEVGMGVSADGTLRATGLEVTGSTVAAAVIEASATVTLEDSSLRDNESGIQVSGSALATVTGNRIDGGEVGLLLLEEARARIVDNTISGAGIGVQVGDQSGPVVRSNRITSSSSAAVVYTGSVGGLLTDNILAEAGEVTVQVAGSARPRIAGNTIEGPGPLGVNYTDDSSGSLVGNTFSGVDGGVQVSEKATPRLESNVFDDLQEYSIVVFDDASGTISGNICASGAPGIILVGGAAPTLEDNNCSVVRG